MTPFEQLKLLYTQLLNIRDEILKYLEKDLDLEATEKAALFESISTQIKLAKKGLSLSQEEQDEIENLDKQAINLITEISTKVTEKKIVIQKYLNNSKNKIKINSAYITESPQNGQILDEEE